MLTSFLKDLFGARRRPPGVPAPAAAGPTFEQLEDRLLLSLVGIATEVEMPNLYYDVTGQMSYTAAAQALEAQSVPLYLIDVADVGLVIQPADVQIQVKVDGAGNLIGGVADQPDLVVNGTLDMGLNGTIDYESPLLTGEVLQFGYLDSGVTDHYDFRFEITGGSLLSYVRDDGVKPFEGKDIGLILNSPNSTFAGTFTEDFGGEAHGFLGPIQPLSSLSGFVYADFNNDGLIDFDEKAIDGVTVALNGVDDRGNAVTQTATSDKDGVYFFPLLRPGEYTITESQPAEYQDGLDTLGTAGGTPSNDVFSGIPLGVGVDGINYNFGERPLSGAAVTAGQTATIGFWQNKNGQELLRSLNGGPDSMQLGDWLAATFPNMYGDPDGANYLGGKTNAEIADFYHDLFKAKAKKAHRGADLGPAKFDCQVITTAFAVYVTNSTLADHAAADYGFLVTSDGLGIATFDVGASIAAFVDPGEDPNQADTVMTVMDILLATNNNSAAGELYSLDAFLRALANEVYTAINEAGDIG